jgi:hypothetical protein
VNRFTPIEASPSNKRKSRLENSPRKSRKMNEEEMKIELKISHRTCKRCSKVMMTQIQKSKICNQCHQKERLHRYLYLEEPEHDHAILSSVETDALGILRRQLRLELYEYEKMKNLLKQAQVKLRLDY